jgi:hypothetical protein
MYRCCKVNKKMHFFVVERFLAKLQNQVAPANAAKLFASVVPFETKNVCATILSGEIYRRVFSLAFREGGVLVEAEIDKLRRISLADGGRDICHFDFFELKID